MGAGSVRIQLVAMNDFHGRISATGTESQLLTDPGPAGVFGPSQSGKADDVLTEVGGSADAAATVQRVVYAALSDRDFGPYILTYSP